MGSTTFYTPIHYVRLQKASKRRKIRKHISSFLRHCRGTFSQHCNSIVSSYRLRHFIFTFIGCMHNTHSNAYELEQLIPKVECYIHIKCRIRELRAIFEPMAETDNRPLNDFSLPSQDEPHSSIVPPAIQANTFKLEPPLVQIMQQNQFSRNPTEDPNLHISVFVQYVGTLKSSGANSEAIRLCLFPFSLRDRSRAWLQSLLANSITTWNELKRVFLARYLPPSKTLVLRNHITTFKQPEGESLFDAWEIYKDKTRLCHHHGLEQWLIIHTFYNSLLYNTRMTIDIATGGALMNKPFEEAYQLIKSLESLPMGN